MQIKKRLFILVAVALSTTVLFQNCGHTEFGSESNSDTKSTQSNSTGQPYDGKVFVASTMNCPDGTYIQSRLVLNTATSATIVRENCQNVNFELNAGDFSLDAANSDIISYKNQTFVKEKPWTPIPILSSWNHQLTGILKASSALVQDIDLFETSSAQIQNMKNSGKTVICNVSAGTFENWRPDAGAFNASDLGNNVSGSNSEKWLDTRSASVRSILLSRLQLAKNKGCDGVDLESSDGYANNSGFSLSRVTQIEYNRFLAFAAHDLRLIVALKNNADLISNLVQSYDLAIAEECFQYNECDRYSPFIKAGKAVLLAEYAPYSQASCQWAQAASMSLNYFSRNLDGSRDEACRAGSQ